MGRERTGTIDRVGDKFRLRMTMPNGQRPPLGLYDSWEEADGVRRAALDELAGREGGNSTILSDWGEAWLKERDREKRVRRPEQDRAWWERHVLPDPIACMPLRGIRPRHIDDLVSSLRAKNLSRGSILKVICVLRGMTKAALRRDLIRVDPFAAGVPLPKETRTDEPWTYLTPEEQERLLAACKGPERHVIAFSIATGLRAGELVSLRLADTHEDRVVVRYGGAPAEPTKNGKIRTVYLNGLARAALTAWLAAVPSYTACKREPNGRNPSGLTFPSRRGRFRSEEHIIRWAEWKAILERAQIGRDVRWHDLRHTCASSLVSGWWGRRWSLEEVREVLGHSELKTTQRYAHLATDAIASATRATGNGNGRGGGGGDGGEQKSVAVAIEGPSIGQTIGQASEADRESSQKQAPPRRFERPTNALGKARDLAEILAESGDVDQLRTTWIAVLFHAAQGDAVNASKALRRVLAGMSGSPLGRLFAGDVSAAVALAPEVVVAIDALHAAEAKVAG